METQRSYARAPATPCSLKVSSFAVLKFFYGMSPNTIALALALGEANANADFLLFLGCRQCAHRIAAVVRE